MYLIYFFSSFSGRKEITVGIMSDKDGKSETPTVQEKDSLSEQEGKNLQHFSEAYFNILGGIEIAAVGCGLPYSGMKNHYMNDDGTKEFLDKFSKENAQWIEQNKLVIRLGSKIFESYMLFLLSRKILNQKGPKNE